MEYIYYCNGEFMMVIYKTTNLKNGKYYIGKQKSYTESYLGSEIALKFAIKKYGKNNFKKEILEICNSNKELENRELWWIDKLDAINDKRCYNLIRETSSNKHRSYKNLEYRQRLSKSIKKILNTPESKLRLKKQNSGKNNPMYGKHRTLEFKIKMSKIHKGKIISKETKEKMRICKLGIKLSKAIKEKMVVSQQNRWNTILIEVNLLNKFYRFDNRNDFKTFVKKYNSYIPLGRTHGTEDKRINWKKALNGYYNFIKIIKK